jgi:membrane protein DedA with SNARE-associated domain
MEFLDHLIGLFAEHGYLAVFLVLLVSGFGVPIPEDVSLVAGGIIAGLDDANVHVMCVVGLAGVLIGDATMFAIGRHFGERALRLRWVAHVLTPRRYAQVKARFERHGNRLMFLARFLPGLRAAVFLTAGMTRRIGFARFLLLDGLAALISVPLWVWVGYVGAENRAWLLASVQRGQTIAALLIVAIVVGAAWLLWRRIKLRRARLDGHRARRAARTTPR